PERDLVFHMPHQWRIEDREDIDFMTAMRRGDWKIVYRMHTGEVELYNLKEDLAEEHNVASEHPDIVASMAGALSNKLRSWDAVMPIDRTTGKPCPLPDEI
ncbi:MAG: sulfatase, partial [Bacteroidales bacterium]|nr:sulfatase [Bacteroidales bacterium]